jgi:hypothetical protein
MSVMGKLSSLALRPVVVGLCETLGPKVVGSAAEVVTDFLSDRFTDQSQRLNEALKTAIERTWTTLEVALAGESFWDRCTTKFARAEDQGFRRQLKAFLDSVPDDRLALPRDKFQRKCLEELWAARKAGLLSGIARSTRQLAEDASRFARFDDPQALLQTELAAFDELTAEFRRAGHVHLATLLAGGEGTPLLVVLVRYFLRRALENDEKLFRALAWSQLERLSEQQTQGLASLERLVVAQGEQLAGMLAEVQVLVVETHSAVLDIQ